MPVRLDTFCPERGESQAVPWMSVMVTAPTADAKSVTMTVANMATMS